MWKLRFWGDVTAISHSEKKQGLLDHFKMPHFVLHLVGREPALLQP